MPRNTHSLLPGLAILLTAATAVAAEGVSPPLVNWKAPAMWSPHGARGVSTMGDITNPVPFIGVDPCRQYDSRNTTPLPTATNRTVTLTGAPCGLPTTAVAVSLNITVFNITGATGNGVFLVGTSGTPTTAWINYPSTETQRGNAGALPTSSGAIVVRVEQGGGSVNFTVDVNGYYTDANTLAANESLFLGGNFPGGLIYSANTSTTYFSSGVYGVEGASTGLTFGVLGRSESTTHGAAGVAGVAIDGLPTIDAAVPSNQVSGVVGYSRSHPGVNGDAHISGVRGRVFDTAAGGFLALGILGFHLGGGMPHDYGVWSTGDTGAFGTKLFVEPHPTDAGKVIRYVALEGPESGTYFRGTTQTVNGTAVIPVPEDFRFVTDDEGLTVQLTPIGTLATMCVVSEDLNQIVVRSNRDVKFHYQVNGVRRSYKDFVPIDEGWEFMPNSAIAAPLASYKPEIQRRLIANGTYNADGTVNMETAERVGWAKAWREREEQARTAAAANAAAHASEWAERR
jgi:hypothetical protein